MQPPNLETIYAALFARFSDKVSVAFCTRRNLTSDDLTSNARQPALVMRTTRISPENEQGMPTQWTLGATVGIYARNVVKDGITDTALLGYVQQAISSLKLQPGEQGEEQTTLGGLVYRAWVVGDVEFHQGETSDQAAAFMDVEMLAFETN